MLGPKSKIFDQESLSSKENKEILMMNDRSTKSAKIVLSKKIFNIKNQKKKKKKKITDEYQFSGQFFVKNIFFLVSIFEPLCS